MAKTIPIWILAIALTLGLANEARAQGFISPFIGYDFGGDASCPQLSLGLIKTHVELTTASLFTADNNNFGWDLGGGVILLFGGHLGVRGDIRHFH